MDCNEVTDRSAPYLDGELARSEVELFESHLDQCEGCRRLLGALAEQDLGPPLRIEGLDRQGFWEPMEAAVGAERVAMGLAGSARPPAPLLRRRLELSLASMVALAAVFLLTLTWGAVQARRADRAEALVIAAGLQADRVERLSASPVLSPRTGTLDLATYTPHRGTF